MRAIERAALALLPHLEQPRDDGQAAARAAILAFLDGVDVEAVARAHWNTLPSAVEIGAHVPWGATGVTYKHLGWVLWDDEDMSESDRTLFRDKARAAIAALRAQAGESHD